LYPYLKLNLTFHSFLSGILAWKDPQVLIPALQIAETLMEKLPETFSKMFIREGVVHAIENLICTEPSSVTPNQASTTDKDSESITGISSRSRRYRRRASGTSVDSTNLDEVKTPPPASGSTETPGSSSSLRVVVSGCAKSFKEKYFPVDSDSSDVGVTDDLRLLRTLCAKLNACAESARAKGKGKSKVPAAGSFDISIGVEDQLNEVVAEILTELSKGDGVSTFEFIGSGVVIALLNYLSCGTFGKEKVPDSTFPKLRQQAIRRYKSFISIALPFDEDGNGAPMTTLVQKLQNALSSLERFPVVLSQSGRSSSSGGARLSSGLSALSQPFKLRLCRAQGEKSLRDYSSNVVLIDPLASLAAVEDFLWPRIQRTDSSSTQKPLTNSESGSATAGAAATASSGSGSVARRTSTRYTRSSVKIGGGTSGKDSQEASGSANTSSSKGKGKAVLKPSSEDLKGPQTRNATRRKSASEKDTEMKPAHDDSSSEVCSV
jgi:E3 ubiquitin-protein ligase TRIP12